MAQLAKSQVFDQIYNDYVARVSGIDLDRIKDVLGIRVDDAGAVIPLFGTPHRVSPDGIVDPRGHRPSHIVSVILCQYLLLCPDQEPRGPDWVTYKDFKDAAPYVQGFRNTTEKPIVRTFSGRMADLIEAGCKLGGRPFKSEVFADIALRFEALPKVPLVMLFNDRDEEFPAECTLLFEQRAEKFLDVECLAMIGQILPGWLEKALQAEIPGIRNPNGQEDEK